ncbi:MAG: (deoxy)nucleoside triphosphate pyrophosphohydrolase [Candidatus Aminicenantes bacterium]|nr:(deoxy)nucleoside triphosphate pyrophosphohydrolase [Candidatus Aminicenantes bacterium]
MKVVRVAAAVIEKDGRVLLTRRGPGLDSAGRWEFPGGKIEPGESAAAALRREIEEELGLRIRVGECLCTVRRRPAGPGIELLAYRAELVGGELRLTDHDAARWVRPQELASFALTEPDRPVAALLEKGDAVRTSGRSGHER